MKLGFDDGRREYRAMIRDLLATDRIRAAIERFETDPADEPDPRPLYRTLGQEGVLAVDWPVEYGGRGRDLLDAAAVSEELILAGVPDTMHVNSVQIVGLFLLLAGTAGQKARLLPGLAAGERFASVLYSEPEAGSDLGALTTTAQRVEGGYVLHGRKRYSLKSHLADTGLCAARTARVDNKYEGITLFLVDMHAPGIRISPIPSTGTERFNDIELDQVFVADSDVVGQPGVGWPLLLQGLAIERTGLDYATKARRWYEAILHRAAKDTDNAESVARHGAELDAGRLLSWRVLWHLSRGHVDERAAAMAKWYTGEFAARIPLWGMRILADDDGDRVLTDAYRDGPGQALSAGTSEIMLEVVASGLHDELDTAELDPLQQELRTALRRELAERPAPQAMERLSVPLLEAPPDAGGLGLGLAATVVVAEELGRHVAESDLLDILAKDGQTDRQRIRHAAYLVGNAAGALDAAIARTGTRQQFDRHLIEFQSIAFRLARAAVQVTAARLAVHRAAWLADHGHDSGRSAIEALATAAELALYVSRMAVHLHGAEGITQAHPVQRYYHAAGREARKLGSAMALWRAAGLDRITHADTPRALFDVVC